LLLDLESTTWSDEACALFEIDPATQPEIADCAASVGETTVFGDPLPVTGLVVDQQGALFAESCFAPGEAKCTYGTGAFILATAGDQALHSKARLAACVAWRLDGQSTYCLDGQVYSAGSAVSWLEELALIKEAADLDRLSSDEGEEALFVPSLAGLGAPFWAPDARGGWLGLSLATSRDDLVRAVIWGIAAQVASLARAMGDDMGRPLERLRVDGGLTRSKVLMQAQADLLQAPVERYPSADATALGAGALARLGSGAASTPQEAVGGWTPAEVFEPRMTAAEAQERLARWESAAAALADLSRNGS
jgi:glycerol kinase